jgi:hypothetical protein
MKVFFLLQLDVQFHTFQSLLWMPSDGIGVVELLDALPHGRFQLMDVDGGSSKTIDFKTKNCHPRLG